MEKQPETNPKPKRNSREVCLDPRSPNFARDFAIAGKAITRKATHSPEAALAVLASEEILARAGKLSKNDGG